jgi:hypothetical protein
VAKQLAPSEHCLFLAELGHFLLVVVVEEAGRMPKDFAFQSCKECILKGWACVFLLMKLLEHIEQVSNKRQPSRALLLGFLSDFSGFLVPGFLSILVGAVTLVCGFYPTVLPDYVP